MKLSGKGRCRNQAKTLRFVLILKDWRDGFRGENVTDFDKLEELQFLVLWWGFLRLWVKRWWTLILELPHVHVQMLPALPLAVGNRAGREQFCICPRPNSNVQPWTQFGVNVLSPSNPYEGFVFLTPPKLLIKPLFNWNYLNN